MLGNGAQARLIGLGRHVLLNVPPGHWNFCERQERRPTPSISSTVFGVPRQHLAYRHASMTDQLGGAITFLLKHLSSPSRVEGWERKELSRTPNPGAIPAEVLREALLNALAHRDYRMASQTRIFVFDDRVEVSNPGELLNRLILDSIRLGISQRRNPRIAALLARAHTARREHLGVGIPEMFRVLREHGLPEPAFRIEGGHFRVILGAR